MATLISFSPGTTIVSASVNSNFNSLNTGSLQINAANAASTPLQILVVQTLPAIQAKGTIAVKVPFALP